MNESLVDAAFRDFVPLFPEKHLPTILPDVSNPARPSMWRAA